MKKNLKTMRNHALAIFQKGLEAVEPALAVRRHCRIQDDRLIIGDRSHDLSQIENIYVVGAGKASAPMAQAMENILKDRLTEGVVNVKYGHTAALKNIRLVQAAHPLPDQQGVEGTGRILDIAQRAGQNDLVICLISGGGSALLPLPSQGLTLSDKQDTMSVLLACGATINEINTIRKHTSGIKGGKLAEAAWPARVISLVLSDVVGDCLDVIASGPTVADPSTYLQCIDIMDKYRIREKVPRKIIAHLLAGMAGDVDETPKPGSSMFENVFNHIIGSNIHAMAAAEKHATRLGYHTLILSSMIEGETRDIARVHGAIAAQVLKTGHPVAPAACILSGGETTVTIKGEGSGGRNQEFALAGALSISGQRNIVILSAGTDGNDGPTDAAGAFSDSDTVKRAEGMGLDAFQYLEDNNAYPFFQALEDLLITGPTNTNVMDMHILLVDHE